MVGAEPVGRMGARRTRGLMTRREGDRGRRIHQVKGWMGIYPEIWKYPNRQKEGIAEKETGTWAKR